MKAQQCRRPEADYGLGGAARSQEKRAQTEQQSVSGRKVWGPSPGAAENQQLVLEEQVLSGHGSSVTGPQELGGEVQDVDATHRQSLHPGED